VGVARFQKSCHPCRISSSSSSIVGTKKERMNVVALVRCCCYVEVGIKEIDESGCGVWSLVIIKGFALRGEREYFEMKPESNGSFSLGRGLISSNKRETQLGMASGFSLILPLVSKPSSPLWLCLPFSSEFKN